MLSVAIKPVCAEVFFTNNENKLECLSQEQTTALSHIIKKDNVHDGIQSMAFCYSDECHSAECHTRDDGIQSVAFCYSVECHSAECHTRECLGTNFIV
jgi:hypothetical protein